MMMHMYVQQEEAMREDKKRREALKDEERKRELEEERIREIQEVLCQQHISHTV